MSSFFTTIKFKRQSKSGNYLIHLLVFTVISLFSMHVFSQDLSYARVKEMAEKYPNVNAVIQRSDIDIYFFKDKVSGEPMIKRVENLKFASLKSKTNVSLIYYRSNNSEFTTRKVFKSNTVCGDYEVEGIFHADAKFCSYSFYANNAGQSFEFELTEMYKDLKYYCIEFFSSEFPALNKTVRFHFPDWIKVDLHPYNFNNISYKVDTLFDSNEGSKIVQYRFLNLPNVSRETQSTSINSNYPHVMICSKSYEDEGIQKKIISDVSDLYTLYKSLIDKTKNDTIAVQKHLEQIVKECKTSDEQIKCIFNWVQQNIRYIAFEYEMAGFIPENAQTVIEKRYGDCKGVANLTKVLLNLAGFDARLCWISTKDVNYSYSMPTLAVDNHMICALFRGDKIFYLDPTATNTNVGEYPEYIQGKEILIENGKSYILERVPELGCELNKFTYNLDLDYSEGKLMGDFSVAITGMGRASLLSFLNELNVEKKSIIQLAIFHNDKNIDWDQTDYTINSESDKEILFKTKVVLKKNALENNGRLILKLSPIETIENAFIDTSRYTNYTFREKKFIVYKVYLEIPKEYGIDKIPRDYVIDNENYKVSYSYVVNGSKIEFRREFQLKKAIVAKENFNAWNQFLKDVRKEDNKRVVLKKI